MRAIAYMLSRAKSIYESWSAVVSIAPLKSFDIYLRYTNLIIIIIIVIIMIAIIDMITFLAHPVVHCYPEQ